MCDYVFVLSDQNSDIRGQMSIQKKKIICSPACLTLPMEQGIEITKFKERTSACNTERLCFFLKFLIF